MSSKSSLLIGPMLQNNDITDRHIVQAYLQVSPQENPRLNASCDASRTDARIQLWRCLNIDDFSATKFYVVPWDSSCIFEVDFLSRHPIIPPMTVDRLPHGWDKWGVVHGAIILVKDREEFVKSMLTTDAFLALPRYRFESFADDIAFALTTGPEAYPFVSMPSTGRLVYDILKTTWAGYSFKIFLDIQADNEYDGFQKNQNLYVTWSCLKGLEYENSDLRRSASEQLQLREDGEGRNALPDEGHPRDIPQDGGQVS